MEYVKKALFKESTLVGLRAVAITAVIAISYYFLVISSWELSFSHFSEAGLKIRIANALRSLVVFNPIYSFGIGLGAHLSNLHAGRVFTTWFGILPVFNAALGLVCYLIYNKGKKSFAKFIVLMILYGVLFAFPLTFAVTATKYPILFSPEFNIFYWSIFVNRAITAALGNLLGIPLYLMKKSS